MAIITDNKTKVSRNIKAELFFTEKHKQKQKQQQNAYVPATFISVIYYWTTVTYQFECLTV